MNTESRAELRRQHVEPQTSEAFYDAAPERPPLGTSPVEMTCPGCHNKIKTEVTFRYKFATHFIAIVLCLIGCPICACILYCTPCVRKTIHYCPLCEKFLGTGNTRNLDH
ncbi:lipopolysaccharide-induced tumor necrosis factor-alpha factor homolog [Teleopsis dalmanni]|uniref:lipopolysaccharide-induced tumor necrosis factor-alpha factor homolog n=1 Tax=Teleopsis dalmanni TaxID=139649 RepID=UPI0018CD1338|nr:lipopolysaccharide-induced tumor necrosis factor-alpha factor homolog [Teleopsis dalmanni]XP_037952109.1 lipopolysaccharide-induced tumor necrosis factor-alpha factor homolog [Teleopsis dalmanni]